MTMEPGEIKISFMQAKNKKEQLQILSELNGCTRKEIRDVLITQGIDEAEIPKPRGPMKKTVETDEPKKLTEKTLPEIIKEALEQKQEEIVNKITELNEKIVQLKEQEEQLTEKYAIITNFIQERG